MLIFGLSSSGIAEQGEITGRGSSKDTGGPRLGFYRCEWRPSARRSHAEREEAARSVINGHDGRPLPERR
jgi:hypothetical protein